MCLLIFLLGSGGGGPETKIRNLTDKPVDVQIRVGSMLMKAYRLRPGRAKTLRRNSIYNKYASGGKNAFYYEGSSEPYVWIHSSSACSVTAKQQFVSLDDLRSCREMTICKDAMKGSFSVLKIAWTKELLSSLFAFIYRIGTLFWKLWSAFLQRFELIYKTKQ